MAGRRWVHTPAGAGAQWIGKAEQRNTSQGPGECQSVRAGGHVGMDMPGALTGQDGHKGGHLAGRGQRMRAGIVCEAECPHAQGQSGAFTGT